MAWGDDAPASSSSSGSGESWAAQRPTWHSTLSPETQNTHQLNMHHMMDLFTIADTDGNGILDRDEVRTLLQTDQRCTMGICFLARQHAWVSEGDLDEIMEAYDHEDKGGLTFHEFMELVQDGILLDGTFDEYRAVFAAADLDGDGTLDIEELTLVMQQLGQALTPAEVQGIMEGADLDRNSRIDFNEFLRLFHAQLLDLPRMLRYIKMRPLVLGEEAPPTAGWAHSLGSGSLTLLSGAAQWRSIMQGVPPTKLLVTMFGLSGDAICQKAAAGVAALAAAYRACVFVQVHVDTSPDAKDLFKSRLLGRATPAFFFIRGGRLLHSHAGLSTAVLEQHLREHLSVVEQPLRPVVLGAPGAAAAAAAAPPSEAGGKPAGGFSMADLVYNIDN